MTSEYLGIVLAGGQGRRLGGDTPKALAVLGGETLLDRACRRLAEISAEVIVVAPASIDLPSHVGAERAHDGGEGPLGGLVAGLERAQGRACVVLGVDLPFVEPALLRWELETLEAIESKDIHAVVPRPRGIPQPLAAAYAPGAVTILGAALAEGQRSVLAALERIRVAWVSDDRLVPGGPESFLNVNTPDDMERARDRVASDFSWPTDSSRSRS